MTVPVYILTNYIMVLLTDTVTSRPRQCGSGEWTCRNGDCIPENYRCDDQSDCYDGSDEVDCGKIKMFREAFLSNAFIIIINVLDGM